ncbi:hypothetical protein IC235_17440 [Hymenobacter sp. BT664]|uniref:Uncharacterized protein n=1 Tax=Hymenobacter montanus TaxID=2771359 RepID=A0A927GKL2_9BACT|nr:hypothetical protein [Hymenobacter montanus]MBD2769677.1 hypothetical protein [Hymenobacter montanus]
MLTQAENAEARRNYTYFEDQCTAYKALLATASLPFSTDLDVVTSAYRQQLFDGLLKIDQGLKARYELLRTEEGRQKLVAETINLDGHDVIDEVATSLQQLRATYQRIGLPGNEGYLHQAIHFDSFASMFNLDLGKALDGQTIKWAGNEHVLAYFQQLATFLTGWKTLVAATIKQGASVQDAVMYLPDFFESDLGIMTNEPVRVDEKRLHFRMGQHRLSQNIPRPK